MSMPVAPQPPPRGFAPTDAGKPTHTPGSTYRICCVDIRASFHEQPARGGVVVRRCDVQQRATVYTHHREPHDLQKGNNHRRGDDHEACAQ